MKTSVVAALALAMATFGTSNAQAGGWPIAAGVLGGLAVGTAIGATVASANAPTYVYPAYSYPVYSSYPAYATYPAPAYRTVAPVIQPVQQIAPQPDVQTVAPSPTVYVQQPAPVYYPSTVVYAAPYPYVYPYVRFGWGYPRYAYRGYRRW